MYNSVTISFACVAFSYQFWLTDFFSQTHPGIFVRFLEGLDKVFQFIWDRLTQLMSSVKIPFVFLRFLAFMNMDTGTSKYLLVFKILQALGEMVGSLTFSDFVNISKFSLIAPGSISCTLAFWQQLSVLLPSQHLHVTNLTTETIEQSVNYVQS